MKRIGMIGGLTWHSTLEYYRRLNQLVCERLGEMHSAELVLVNVDRGPLVERAVQGDEGFVLEKLSEAVDKTLAAGADFAILCANGAHRFFDELERRHKLPLLHIADAAAAAIRAMGLKKVGLLGIRKTMEDPFYRDRLARRGIEVVIPEDKDRDFIERTVHYELSTGKFLAETKREYIALIERLAARGATGAVMGCTEIPLRLRDGG